MAENNSFDIQVTNTTNIFPETRLNSPTSVPLSIFDNASAGFARCAAVWFYDPPSDPASALTSLHLQFSLSKTLNYYAPWCGRLSYATPKPDGGHTHLYQRIWVTYNTPNDIGISFVAATSPKTLSDFLPSISTRRTSMKAWDGSQLPSSELFPKTSLSISEDKDAPNVIVQFTTFECGSTAVAIETTHCLADAVSLSQFAKDWSITSRSMLANQPLPKLSPVFSPQLLDFHAAGNIDSPHPDFLIQFSARSLPQHRYDWYLHVPNQPWETHTPSDFDNNLELSPSTPIPWNQWDVNAPVSHSTLHFSASEIQNIYALAIFPPSGIKISKHDALLAHVWSLINTARSLPLNTVTYLDMTFGLRPRVSPPLPNSFLGSPITHAAIPYTITDSRPELDRLAKKIRTTLKEFSSESIAELLHDNAYEVAPQRLWRACLGREHVLLTTWVHSGVYEVDFMGGKNTEPRYVEAVMLSLDGLVEVMEAGRVKEGESWFEEGVDVSVYLEEKVM